MKWKPLAHDGREARIICRLTNFISFYFEVAIFRSLKDFFLVVLGLDIEVKVFEIKASEETSWLECYIIFQCLLIEHFLCYIELNRFEDPFILKYLARFDICYQCFHIQLGQPDKFLGQVLQEADLFTIYTQVALVATCKLRNLINF